MRVSDTINAVKAWCHGGGTAEVERCALALERESFSGAVLAVTHLAYGTRTVGIRQFANEMHCVVRYTQRQIENDAYRGPTDALRLEAMEEAARVFKDEAPSVIRDNIPWALVESATRNTNE